MNVIQFIRQYFAERFSPLIRVTHYAVMLFVLSQIVVSNFMEISDDGKISNHFLAYYGTWVHIITGLFLVLVATVFIVVELKKHGLVYFYPWLYGDLSRFKLDLQQLKSLELPAVSAKGLVAIVQGLGLGALFLVVFSGLSWFILWSYHSPLADYVKEIHESLTALIEAYIIGHGGIGVIHLFISYKDKLRTL